ncbi:MAG TPA: Flp family type IVb pilin [Methyloceanibacter sp.]|nr:Flp family type IVb pilin [Methyloceanibacter sp.]
MFYLFATDNAGASAVEYALLTFIALALVAAVGLLGDTLTTLFQRIAGAF